MFYLVQAKKCDEPCSSKNDVGMRMFVLQKSKLTVFDKHCLIPCLVSQIDAGDVEIVYDQAGRSTGIAYVSFPSPTDAKKAVRDLNNKYIGHRYVELSLA